MIEQQKYGPPPNWCALTVTGGWELATVRRISEAGFEAHCPVYSKKYRVRGRAPNLFRIKSEPLFPTYVFLRPAPNFRREKFETTRVSIIRVRGGFITDEQMTLINLTANELTMIQSKTTQSMVVRRGDVMQILHGAMQGEPVEVLQAKKDEILIRWRERAGWRDVWINRTALGKAI